MSEASNETESVNIDKLVVMDDIDEKKDEVLYLREKFLRNNGWEHRCDFPGAFWLWCKEVNGVLIAVSVKTACDIEVNI